MLQKENLEPEQKRALKRLALVALAGDLAREFKILPLEESDIENSITYIRDLWLKENTFVSDAVRAVKSIKDFILENPSRFQKRESDIVSKKSVGYYNKNNIGLYLFHDSGFEEATNGVNTKYVCKELRKRGLLHMNNNGKNKSRFQIVKGIKKQPFFAIKKSIINEVF